MNIRQQIDKWEKTEKFEKFTPKKKLPKGKKLKPIQILDWKLK
jgi:hypothetical protein